MITTIIFDIGNVLAGFTWKEHYESFGYDEQMVERIAKATVKNPDWNEFDRGAMSEEEIVQAFVKADPEIEEDIWKVLQNVSTMIKRLDYAIPWIQELKSKDIGCYIYPTSRIRRRRTAPMRWILFLIRTAVFCPIGRRSLSRCRRFIRC